MRTTPNRINVRWCPKCPGMTQFDLSVTACVFCKGPTYERNVIDETDIEHIIEDLARAARKGGE